MGFHRATSMLCSPKGNILSAVQHPQVVSKYLAREASCDQIVGPLEPSDSQQHARGGKKGGRQAGREGGREGRRATAVTTMDSSNQNSTGTEHIRRPQ